MSKSIDVRTFENELFSLVSYFHEGVHYFRGIEMLERLGYQILDDEGNLNRTNVNNRFTKHCPERTNISKLSTFKVDVLPDGIERRNTVLITEGDVYRLVMGSRKPEALQFKNWVAEEVLPSIRKHGGYHEDQFSQKEAREDSAKEQANSDIHGAIAMILAEMREERKETNARLERMDQRHEESRKEFFGMFKEIMANKPQVELKPLEEGHVPGDSIHSMVDGIISDKALKSLLHNLGWTTGTYEEQLKTGAVATRVSYPVFNPTSAWGPMTIMQAADRMVRETLRGVGGAGSISLMKYRHPLVDLQNFRIKGH